MNYITLTDQIKSYANRTDALFNAQIPNFIEQGINRIYSEAKNIGFEVTTTGNIAINNTTISKPANWRETISLEIYTEDQTFSKFLFNRSYEFCKTYWPNQTETSIPDFYADYQAYDKIFISPTADKAYQYSLIYLGVPLFNTENSENFLTRRYPRLLFYACMLEAMPFLKDDERLGQFEQLYASSLDDINKDSTARYVDRISDRGKD
jgi:hypothetical protein